MLINLEFDSRAQAAPQSFRDAIQAAANVLDATFTDNITVNITVGYGEIEGTPEPSGGASAGPNSGVLVNYSQVRTWLAQNAAIDVQSGVAAMSTGTSIQGQSQVAVWLAQERLMGLAPANDPRIDGAAGFATNIPTSSLEGVALHELTHALGRVPYGPQPDILDLYRFTGQGTRLFTDSIPAAASYFSLDGGRTDLADYGRNSDPSDFLNSSGRTPNDPFNEFYNASTVQSLSHIDLLQMEALGFHTAGSSPSALFGTTTHDPNSLGGQVYLIYDGLLGRAPDPLGLEYWVSRAQAGESIHDITAGFLSSPEFTSDYGPYQQISAQAFVGDIYLNVLHRPAEAGGLQYWSGLIANGYSREEIADHIAFSPEHVAQQQSAFDTGVFVTNATDATIARLYYALDNRAPDAAGLQTWETSVAQGTSLQSIAQSFINSSEYQALHGPQTNQQFVDAMYHDVFGSLNPAAEQGFVNELTQGTSRAAVAVEFAQSSAVAQQLVPNIEAGLRLS
jgi:hypothetical protein